MNVLKLLTVFTFSAATLALTACNTLESRNAGVLRSKVRAEAGVTGPFVVTVFDRNSGHIVQRAFLEQTGSFDMIIDSGNYKFLAFADLDRDGQLGADEPASLKFSMSTTIQPGDLIELPSMQVRSRTTALAQQRPEIR